MFLTLRVRVIFEEMKTIFIILAVFLLSVFIPITTASTDYKIVINEFEQNPSGTDSGNEWTELYNPTSSTVDISGWTVSTTQGRTVTVTISHGTTIAANGYYALDSFWGVYLVGFF